MAIVHVFVGIVVGLVWQNFLRIPASPGWMQIKKHLENLTFLMIGGLFVNACVKEDISLFSPFAALLLGMLVRHKLLADHDAKLHALYLSEYILRKRDKLVDNAKLAEAWESCENLAFATQETSSASQRAFWHMLLFKTDYPWSIGTEWSRWEKLFALYGWHPPYSPS